MIGDLFGIVLVTMNGDQLAADQLAEQTSGVFSAGRFGILAGDRLLVGHQCQNSQGIL